jgi:sodium/hydrogen antiporter
MQPYIVVLTGFSIVVLVTAWLPMVVRELPLSLPTFCVGLGAAVFSIPGIPGIAPHPEEHLAITERISELAVIVALMGAGLKLDHSLASRTAGMTVTPAMRRLDGRRKRSAHDPI